MDGFLGLVYGCASFVLNNIGAISSVVLISIAFSGDNAVGINAIANELPFEKQRIAIILGLVLAAVVRVPMLYFANLIMELSWVQIIGALYLLYLPYQYFMGSKKDRAYYAHTLFVMVLLQIAFLDTTLSIDNVVAVIAITSDFRILVIGVIASIVVLAVATTGLRYLMERYALVEPAAYLVLIFLGVVILLQKVPEFLGLGGYAVDISDTWKMTGVLGIFFVAMIIEEFHRHRERKKHR